MNIKITSKDGLTLKTKGKYVKEDISVSVDESLMGITPTGTYQVTDNGEYDITEYAKVNVNVASSGGEGDMLQARIDSNNSCEYLFYKYNGSNVDFIRGLDTSRVENFSYMFSNSYITRVPLLNFSKATNVSHLFSTCNYLVDIPYIEINQNISTDNMFYMCRAVETLEINIPNSSTGNSMFSYCQALKSLSRLQTKKMATFSNMFNNCYLLPKIDVSYYDFKSTNYTNKWCGNCYSLKTIIIREFSENIALNSNAFTNCYHLDGTVNETYNPNGDKDCYIYVPSTMVDTLKSATNWSTYADQIKPLSELEEEN